ncbi:MAG TPA: LCP family protein [Candidatus Dormibacteraeota bacterium]
MASTTRRRRRSSYDLVPTWVTRGRVLLACVVLVIGLVGGYGARLVFSLAHLFGESPISVITDILHHGSGGSGVVANRFANGQRVNIALYGYGGNGHDGAYLSDSIMVVSIQPRGQGNTPQIAEISIPRDLFVPIPVGGSQKTYYARVNEAYSIGQAGLPVSSADFSGDHGGGSLANATLSKILGIPIDHFVGLDFTAFKSAVDSVGGVDINVEHTFTDTNYPRGECDDPKHPDCAVETVHFNAGPQHMDGATALIFARSRESADPLEGTNFARNKRQQLVLAALKQRVLSAGGLGNLPDLLNSLGDHVKTDLPLGDALALYDLVKGVDTTRFEHVSVDAGNFIYDCGPPYGTASCPAAYEYPYDRSFGTLQHFAQNIFPPTGAIAEHAPVSVVDGSGRGSGASKRWASLFSSAGLAATDGGAAKVSPTTHVIDSSGGRDTGTALWLARFFGVQVETPAPASAAASATGATGAAAPGGVTLVLGQEEERAFYGSGSSPSAYAGQYSGASAPGTGTGVTAPRRATAPPATARPVTPPPATSAATPGDSSGGLLPPLVSSTDAPSPRPSPRPTPTPRGHPRPSPSPTP